MFKKILLLSLLLIGIHAVPAYALDQDLAKKATELSARADAMTTHCGKKSELRTDMMGRAKKDGLDKKSRAELSKISDNVYNQEAQELADKKQDCKDVEFMINRLKLMRELKSVMNKINGIAEDEDMDGGLSPIDALFPHEAGEIPEIENMPK